MAELNWRSRIDVAVTGEDVDAAGRLKAEACSLWALMALDAAARAVSPAARLVSLTLELGSAQAAPGASFLVEAEITKSSRALAFVAARADDEEGRALFSASGVFGLAPG